MNSLTKFWQKSQELTVEIRCPLCHGTETHIIKMDESLVNDILLKSINNSIKHWCCRSEYKKDYNFVQGNTILLYNSYDFRVYSLNIDQFLMGVVKAYLICIDYNWEELNPDYSIDYSNRLCDTIIQFAVFGEIRYPYIDNGGNCCDD